MKIDRVKFAMALAKENISCLKLAERTGLSRVTITNVKSGKSCTKSTAEKVANGLGVKISDLLPEKKEGF